ncbi:SsrA-binding protein [Algoriphagus alkaliphilus]|jgi:SsrA-binding protein|uniref:SsrA-binding protein n=1 Tax=Algoriphagus alkaliphilus TaxID=279824 RepID=A0A1G5WFY9_9BACT|nr:MULTISPECIES: SsrA-binding protein [Algoriphagus]MBA4299234.1 SsrA-binding protein [Cyclobacterium sp.]MDO8968989.1 SsrA-binding protein [Algoriphagus sp.]MDP2041418.1 SsrA-binding protein [Algoriphagus sp.]MDP3200219.1 SsrA-binding protein [Algoriphagus sp.]MDP3473724.1 SsrA-binding protein [Algoriphagus sp.]
MAKSNRFEKFVNIKNKKANFQFEFIDTYVTGIMLTGTEIKSIRESKVSLTEAFCIFLDGELYIRQMHISPYSMAASYNHLAVRDRKLLLKKKELEKLETKSAEKGLAIIPVRIFINDRGLAKLEIALARGKKTHDKRQDLKEKDAKRELQRMAFD